MRWTEKQLDVIHTKGRNILVSAAAGSGKTAVLVERIIQMITDPDNPTDIDQLLVVTFTRAAASEMKERIREALETIAEKKPEDSNVQRQLSFIHNANISTIDSFCAGVVKENFDKIDLDPNFRIADETEIEMLKSDIIEEILEEYYEKGEEGFLCLAKQYSTGKISDNIKVLIDRLYGYACGHHNPKQWVENCVKYYELNSFNAFENSTWMKSFLEHMRKQMEGYVEELQLALQISESEEGPKYGKGLRQLIEDIELVQRCETYDKMRNAVMAVRFVTLSGVKNCNPDKKQQVAAIKTGVTKALKKMQTDYFARNGKELYGEIVDSADSVRVIVELTLDFMERFAKEKSEKGIMDFNDQAHYALRILNDVDEQGNLIPSDTARQMSSKFKEIMIDEYQDSNFVQEAILSSVAGGQGVNNMFMVGDVKQSIYRFRQAKPKLFLDKYDCYSEQLNSPNCKIILDQNFRSRKEVIDSVNYIFNYVMHRQVGGIDYKNDNQLVLGAEYEELPAGQDNSTEFIMIEGSERKMEAAYVAEKIREITDPVSGMKITEKGKEMRPVTYGDIAILLRSVKGKSEIYMEQLENNKIPAYAESRTGYYQAMEVKTIISALSVIDNPRQDIPLAAVLVSPMFQFTSEELAEMKTENVCETFFDCLQKYAANGSSHNLRDKTQKFMELLDYFRDKVPYTSVYEIINELLELTGYGYYIRSMVNGERRYLNIEALKEKAVAYDAISYKGLFNFIRYIEKLNYLAKDDGEASSTSENDNIVHIMSIHKSKGLQFPIVFLCDAGASPKTDHDFIVANERGIIGVDYIDYNLKIKEPTIIKKTIKIENNEEDKAEALRILYVALTRAKEKLFITGLTRNMKKTLLSYGREKYNDSSVMSYTELVGNNSFMDWIGKSIGKNKAFDSVLGEYEYDKEQKNDMYDVDCSIKVDIIREDEIVFEELKEQIMDDIRKETLERLENSHFGNDDTEKMLKHKFNFTYPFLEDVHLHSKASVTEIKKQNMSYEEEYDGYALYDRNYTREELIPKFLVEAPNQPHAAIAAERGTAYHRIFELLNMNEDVFDRSVISQMTEQFVKAGLLTNAQLEAVDLENILHFTHSSLFARMRKAYKEGRLYRERKFLMGVPAGEINEQSSSKETVIIQGIIDVCFIEEERYVIADYKTDRVETMEQLAERYHIQLQCYKKAIEQISGIEVSEMILYSVYLGKEISI